MKKLLLLILLCGLLTEAGAQRFVDMELVYDTTVNLVTNKNPLPFGLIVTKSNGRQKKSFGYAEGAWGIEWFTIIPENCTVDWNFGLYYDFETVKKTGGKIRFTASLNKQKSLKRTFEIPLPVLKTVHMTLEKPFVFGGRQSLPLRITACYDNDRCYRSINTQDSAMLASVVQLEVNGRRYGLYDSVALRPNIAIDSFAIVNAVDPSDSTILASLKIPFDYASPQVIDFSGASAPGGAWGKAYGANGQNGYHGANGEPLKVAVTTAEKNGTTYLLVKVAGRTLQEFTVADALKGKVDIRSNGGNGGVGGKGHNGFGNDHEYVPAGSGGSGGDGGDGGEVIVYCDSAAFAYIDIISISNYGGIEGKGGEPGKPDGSHGSGGRPGKDGPIPQVNVISSDRVLRMFGDILSRK